MRVRGHAHIRRAPTTPSKLRWKALSWPAPLKTRDVLPQLDGAEVIEWLAEQGYIITHQERAA